MPDYVIKTTDDTLLPTREVAAQAAGLRGALGLGTLATQNGTFSGTSSGTNTGDQTITLSGDATGSGTGSITVNVGKVNGVDFNSIGTGILKIESGAVAIAEPAAFPTLNQNTTGSAGSVLGTTITGATLAANVINSSLTTVGAITQGQWTSATPVGIAYGGTGAITAAAAFAALQPQNLSSTGTPSFAGLILTGTFTAGSGSVLIESTQGNISTNGTISSIGAISTQASLITIANAASPTDTTANGAGLTVPSTLGGAKTLTWASLTASWSSNQNFSISTGKTYKINGTDVLSSTALGSSVVSSSLTSVGTITTGYWNSFIGSPGTPNTNYVTAAQVISAVNNINSGTLDADLNAIAAISDLSTGYLKKTAANTWSLEAIDTSTFALNTDPRFSDARYPIIQSIDNATQSQAGWMSAADKTILDGVFISPAFTGNPTAPTQLPTDVSDRIATTSFVEDALGSIENSINDSLDTILFNNVAEEPSATTLTLNDTYLYKYVRLQAAGAITLNLPARGATVADNIGAIITIRRTTNAGAITLTPASGVTINNAAAAAVNAGDTFSLKYLGSDTWDFSRVLAINNYAATNHTHSAAGVGNTAVGENAFISNTSGINNTAFGLTALTANTTGNKNTAIGSIALFKNTAAEHNTAVGFRALESTTIGGSNTAVGAFTLRYTVGTNSTAFGYAALQASTVSDNTAVGANALAANTSGTFNTAVGASALSTGLTGAENTAVGFQALNVVTGNNNTAVGKNSLKSATAAANNTAVGWHSLFSNTTASSNTAFGSSALTTNTTGDSNTATGAFSLQANTTGSDNTAVGYGALNANTTGFENTSSGTYSLNANTTGSDNTAVGSSTLVYNTTGDSNTAAGAYAMYANTTGGNNTAFGSGALNANTTGTFNTAVGYNALLSTPTFTNTSGFGNGATVTANNQVQLGDSTTTVYVYGSVQSRSDRRDKTDVRDTVLGLDFISALRPVDYKWDMREDYRAAAPDIVSKPEDLPENASVEDAAKYDVELAAYEEYAIAKDAWIEDVKLANIIHDGSKTRDRYHHGLIAQEVKDVLTDTGVDFGGFQDHSLNGGDDVLSLGYEELIAPMIKAIQELKAMVLELQAERQ